MRIALACMMTVGLAASDIGPESLQPNPLPRSDPSLCRVVASLAGDAAARELCHQRGLDLMSLTWEDTGRNKNSCWGPNISDLTIQVLDGTGMGSGDMTFMPVIRRPNFSDISCDVAIEHLKLLVGNERGQGLRAIDLASYLRDFAQYQHAPTGRLEGSLLASRDHEVLVSAQACVLPVSAGGTTSFAPVLFNYQACSHDPAVLVIMATPEGTSAQVMSANAAASTGVAHGQRLFHNRNGQRAVLQAQRWSDHQAACAASGGVARADAAAGLSLVLIIQVPLLQHFPSSAGEECCAPVACPQDNVLIGAKDQSVRGIESAVISSGASEGPWIGLDQCTIQRDPRFPIRATVQFYQASDYAGLAAADVARFGSAIDRIYLDADSVGSLVVSGLTERPTEPTLVSAWPQPWWRDACLDYTRRTGEPWTRAVDRLHQRLGVDWQPQSAQELCNALTLVQP